MKTLLFTIACFALLTACHKNKNSNDLVGTWKMTETYRIGQIDWTTVWPTEAATLTFNNNYTYTLTPPLISSASACNGTYRIAGGNQLFMATACQANPAFEEELTFTRNGNTLILDHIMSATGIRVKYVKQ